MASEIERATDLSFKKLTGYQYTSNNKKPYEEQGSPQLKLHSSNLWTATIPSNPLVAMINYYNKNNINQIDLSSFTNDNDIANYIDSNFSDEQLTDGVSFIRKRYQLLHNHTVDNALAWLIGRFNSNDVLFEYGELDSNNNWIESNGYIGTQYGSRYAAQLFVNGNAIGSANPCGWNFDYDIGILTFLDASPIKLTKNSLVEIICYKYIGTTGAESMPQPFDDDLGTFILTPAF